MSYADDPQTTLYFPQQPAQAAADRISGWLTDGSAVDAVRLDAGWCARPRGNAMALIEALLGESAGLDHGEDGR